VAFALNLPALRSPASALTTLTVRCPHNLLTQPADGVASPIPVTARNPHKKYLLAASILSSLGCRVVGAGHAGRGFRAGRHAGSTGVVTRLILAREATEAPRGQDNDRRRAV
jgi:hypothetical protein